MQNNPLMHHNIIMPLMKVLRAALNVPLVQRYVQFRAKNPNYPGPKQSGPDGERLRLKSAELYDEALKYCTNCKTL